jgi:hypothetical protein
MALAASGRPDPAGSEKRSVGGRVPDPAMQRLVVRSGIR